MLQVNPVELVQKIKQGQNPQQLILGILENQMGNTPMGQNLMALVKEKRTKEIEQIARNLLSQKGLDFDVEFTAFKQKLGL